ncbi:TPA: LacI family transcriptional regulator [Candidatus Bipolaricaulota bacterium]|nr:LacI family transcriptional regulator [Candidatus Bipolaricaulota bacterium]
MTTVRVPRDEAGAMAVELLVKKIESTNEDFRWEGEELLETKLIIRESCGCRHECKGAGNGDEAVTIVRQN